MPLRQRCRSLYLSLQYTLNAGASETLPHFSEGGETVGELALVWLNEFASLIEPVLHLYPLLKCWPTLHVEPPCDSCCGF
jgi:hypothetical protein